MTDKIKTLQDLIDLMSVVGTEASPRPDIGFDMLHANPFEDRACCIGGWVITMNRGGDKFYTVAESVSRLDGVRIYADAKAICSPPRRAGSEYLHPAWYHATPAHAVALLTHYRDTGVVDWDRAMAHPAIRASASPKEPRP